MDNVLKPLAAAFQNKMVYGPILTILIAYLIYNIVKSVLYKIEDPKKYSGYDLKRRKTVVDLIANFIKIFTIVIVLLVILNLFGINTTSIIASLGVASAVIGLAFQDTLKDVIGGVNIIMDNYFIVGDIVKYNDFTGEVISFGFKATKIKNLNNEVLTVANRNITQIINLSKEKAAVQVKIPVAYEEDIDKVEKVIDKILADIAKSEYVDAKTVQYLGVDELSDSSVNLLIKFISERDKQWITKREALKIVKKELDKNGVKIPYQQIEVHNGKNI
ncbi:MAG: mechanosensitive ion channel family protein [Firmicutes bacterium]|jgi:small conductance mechanosensitive channel|nr:mechanosensitive ion channel family protein [Bacillota bacterium]